MPTRRSVQRLAASLAAVAVVSLGAQPGLATDFEESLARVDEALRKNPGRVNVHALESCQRQRNAAVKLYDSGQAARAAPTVAEVQARAAREVEHALSLAPDLENGLAVYRGCAECHMPEGWGLSSGLVPQLAGQHRTVVIKQLADIRAGNRATVVMAPYATVEIMGGAQGVADVAGYIDTLEMTAGGGKGPGDQLELGEELYRNNCARCHGPAGEGDADSFVPRIQAQHYGYLVRQFEWIRDGRRRNANAEMQAQIQDFDDEQISAVLDYVSRLEPPPELQAPPEWSNPDFAE